MKKYCFIISLALLASSLTLSLAGESLPTISSATDNVYVLENVSSDQLLAAAPRKKTNKRKSTSRNSISVTPKKENYPDLDIFTVIQQNEDKLNTYTPPFDKATTYKLLVQALTETGLDASILNDDFTIGSGTIGKDRQVVVAVQLDNFENAPAFIADVKDGKAVCSFYWAVRTRSEFEMNMHCEDCGWHVPNVYCMYYFSDNERPYLLGVWNKTQSDAPKKYQQTLPFVIRLFK